ncbi:MAG: hypothetical protein RL268_478 [Pseudomonadota bacterium]|jgi:hypothetical protein
MTTIVSALNRVARQVSVSLPSSWVTSTETRHAEIRDDFLIETAEDILDRVDLPSPISSTTTITGTGVEAYTLPSDFRRLHRGRLAVYESSLDRGVWPVTSDAEWTALVDSGVGAERYYKITGYEGNFSISFYAHPSTDIVVHYVTKNWMISSGGAAGSMFTADDDILLLPNRIVEAGIVWRWRERKGLPFMDKYNEYELLMTRHTNDLRVRRTIGFGARRVARWQDNIPAEIPDV